MNGQQSQSELGCVHHNLIRTEFPANHAILQQQIGKVPTFSILHDHVDFVVLKPNFFLFDNGWASEHSQKFDFTFCCLLVFVRHILQMHYFQSIFVICGFVLHQLDSTIAS